MKKTVILAVIAGAAWLAFTHSPVPQVHSAPPEVTLRPATIADAPLQRDVGAPAVFRVNDFELRTLHAFALKARALSVERYRMGRESELSPVDIAFGWGRMSEPAVIEQLSISQSGRWYHWRYSGSPPLPTHEIATSSANMHLIPANPAVARVLNAARKGQIVSLRGYLVEARAKDGWTWRSSTRRDDTGNGSCELVFVQAAELH